MTFIADNFSAIHLILACLAMLYAKRNSPQWKIAAAYVGIYCAAGFFVVWSSHNGLDSGPNYYLYCIPFECAIAALTFWRHPMSRWLAVTSLFAITMHLCAYFAYFSIPLLHSVFRFLWSVHSITIPIVELSQVAGIFVFALPVFKSLDAPKKEQEVTWLAKTSAIISR